MTKRKKRASVERPYNAWTMTAAEKHTMIINALRKLSTWWKPITRTKAAARVWVGTYKCANCWKTGKEYSSPPKWKKRRIKNFAVDHKQPAVPVTWWVSYDHYIESLFLEQGEGLRMLCKICHTDDKSKKENELRREIVSLNKKYEGVTFWRLSILRFLDKKMAECECECWAIRKVNIYNLKNWHTRSCWCIAGTHKMSKTRIYSIWTNINSRCSNPNATWYKYYWWRWIDVEWDCFEDFHKDMEKTYNDKLTIDRIDVNWNYSKENCRWATYKEQWNNKVEYNHHLTFEWETFTISEWADKIGIKQNTVLYRIRRGWTVGEALGIERRAIESKKILKSSYYDDIINLLKTNTQAQVGKKYWVDGSVVSRFLKAENEERRKNKLSNNT